MVRHGRGSTPHPQHIKTNTTMTKEQFLEKWGWNIVNDAILPDLEAVIATEITNVQPEKTRKIEISDYTLVEICRAFRALRKDKNSYIHHVFSDDYVFHAMNEIEKAYENYFGKKTEQITTDQVTDQEQPAKPFDRDRFERMFCAVVASGVQQNFECFKIDTTYFLQQLDAYYATKNN